MGNRVQIEQKDVVPTISPWRNSLDCSFCFGNSWCDLLIGGGLPRLPSPELQKRGDLALPVFVELDFLGLEVGHEETLTVRHYQIDQYHVRFGSEAWLFPTLGEHGGLAEDNIGSKKAEKERVDQKPGHVGYSIRGSSLFSS